MYWWHIRFDRPTARGRHTTGATGRSYPPRPERHGFRRPARRQPTTLCHRVPYGPGRFNSGSSRFLYASIRRSPSTSSTSTSSTRPTRARSATRRSASSRNAPCRTTRSSRRSSTGRVSTCGSPTRISSWRAPAVHGRSRSPTSCRWPISTRSSFVRPYYVGPGAGGEKVYALLARAMEESGLAAVVTFVMRDQQHLGALRVVDGLIVLEQLRFADEQRPVEGIRPTGQRIARQELEWPPG